MSFYRVFSPTDDAIEKYRKKNNWSYTKHDLNDEKIGLLLYCLSTHEGKQFKDIISEIKFKLKWIYFIVKEEEEQYAVNLYDKEEDKTVWYCGWQFSHNEPDISEEENYNISLERLSMLATIVKTPDWFDENEKFFDKVSEINSNIDGFIESCREIAIYGIMDDLKEFEDRKKSDMFDEESDEEEKEKSAQNWEGETEKNSDGGNTV